MSNLYQHARGPGGADRLIQAEPRSREVIFPVINGQEVNNNPEQAPGREIINVFFHTHGLTPTQVAKVSKKSQEEAEAGYQSILELRRLYRELDEAVRDAYGWYILDLGHDFQEVETLPENDRVRYTISPMARKEVLRRLLALNHQCTVAQAAALVQKQHGKRGKAQADHSTPEFFC